MPKRFPRPTYGSVTATLALCIALGGTSYAAVKVTGADIRNSSLTGADIRNGSLKSRDVRDGSLTGSDVRDGSLAGADVADGSLLAGDFAAGQLPAGAPGLAGPPGPAGPGGLTDVVTRIGTAALDPDDTAEARAACEQGEFAVGGGAGYDGDEDKGVAILVSEPYHASGRALEGGERASAWRAYARNVGINDHTVVVRVLCAKG